jgi:hypothetical protein
MVPLYRRGDGVDRNRRNSFHTAVKREQGEVGVGKLVRVPHPSDVFDRKKAGRRKVSHISLRRWVIGNAVRCRQHLVAGDKRPRAPRLSLAGVAAPENGGNRRMTNGLDTVDDAPRAVLATATRAPALIRRRMIESLKRLAGIGCLFCIVARNSLQLLSQGAALTFLWRQQWISRRRPGKNDPGNKRCERASSR